MRARKNGFLFYRWDGAYVTCKTIIQRVVISPWVGILYPDEEVEGELERFVCFLQAQPAEVAEVVVQCRNGDHQPRFLRTQPLTTRQEQRSFQEITIR